jgi:hypothetical protein
MQRRHPNFFRVDEWSICYIFLSWNKIVRHTTSSAVFLK